MDDWLAFRTYRTFFGAPAPIDLIRRNGQAALRHRHDWNADTLDLAERETRSFAERRNLLRGLTPMERRTWRRLLDGWSVDAIAVADGASRAAVYARIRGSHGRGGMVRKNAFVAAWWRRRREQAAHTHHAHP
jgi:DNA-binding CsgD family transcriptional regulator